MTSDVTSYVDDPNPEFDQLLSESLANSFALPDSDAVADRILASILRDDAPVADTLDNNEIASSKVLNPVSEATDSPRRTIRRWSVPVRRVVAVAAVMLGLVGSWMIWNYFNNPASKTIDPYQQPHRTSAQIYASAATDSEPFWVCKDQRQFMTTFWQRLGYGAKLKSSLPDGAVALGLSYADSISENSILLGGTYRDTEPVVVIIDRLDADDASDTTGPKYEKPDPATGLKIYRREAPPLVFYEISKLDHPVLLESIEPAEMPDEWIPGHGRKKFNTPPPKNNNKGADEGGN